MNKINSKDYKNYKKEKEQIRQFPEKTGSCRWICRESLNFCSEVKLEANIFVHETLKDKTQKNLVTFFPRS